MPRIKFTKNELKKHKEALNRFKRYLPTLMLKKQQLQMEIRKIKAQRDDIADKVKEIEKALFTWIELFGQGYDLSSLLNIKSIDTDIGNIAGIDIPVFSNLDIEIRDYDLFIYPLWVDKALEELKKTITLKAELKVLTRQLALLSEELRITSQRVNLFEKVKIPEARETIRMIKIYLGDQQTNAVVRGKIAKNKIKRKAD
ncbi:MAG: V-type ATP synthase subunit D [Spirochaetales bacterium]|nr:V-type ATP synthase subunit D [Spirochaetales bacterium]